MVCCHDGLMNFSPFIVGTIVVRTALDLLCYKCRLDLYRNFTFLRKLVVEDAKDVNIDILYFDVNPRSLLLRLGPRCRLRFFPTHSPRVVYTLYRHLSLTPFALSVFVSVPLHKLICARRILQMPELFQAFQKYIFLYLP